MSFGKTSPSGSDHRSWVPGMVEGEGERGEGQGPQEITEGRKSWIWGAGGMFRWEGLQAVQVASASQGEKPRTT